MIATVAFKKLDYFTADQGIQRAPSPRKRSTPMLSSGCAWPLPMTRMRDYVLALTPSRRQSRTSEPGSQVRQVAEQEKARLD